MEHIGPMGIFPHQLLEDITLEGDIQYRPIYVHIILPFFDHLLTIYGGIIFKPRKYLLLGRKKEKALLSRNYLQFQDKENISYLDITKSQT